MCVMLWHYMIYENWGLANLQQQWHLRRRSKRIPIPRWKSFASHISLFLSLVVKRYSLSHAIKHDCHSYLFVVLYGVVVVIVVWGFWGVSLSVLCVYDFCVFVNNDDRFQNAFTVIQLHYPFNVCAISSHFIARHFERALIAIMSGIFFSMF